MKNWRNYLLVGGCWLAFYASLWLLKYDPSPQNALTLDQFLLNSLGFLSMLVTGPCALVCAAAVVVGAGEAVHRFITARRPKKGLTHTRR